MIKKKKKNYEKNEWKWSVVLLKKKVCALWIFFKFFKFLISCLNNIFGLNNFLFSQTLKTVVVWELHHVNYSKKQKDELSDNVLLNHDTTIQDSYLANCNQWGNWFSITWTTIYSWNEFFQKNKSVLRISVKDSSEIQSVCQILGEKIFQGDHWKKNDLWKFHFGEMGWS